MFTGIIELFGQVQNIESLPSGLAFCIETSKETIETLAIGESIAVNGVCCTVIKCSDTLFYFEASPETLALTTFKLLEVGQKVHLEIPLSLSKPLGGHFVTGHVDEVINIGSIVPMNDFSVYVFENITRPEWICDKGSITLDGVSLTINRVISDNSIECMLIPHTINNTRFKRLKVGERVNVEYDYLAKIIARQYALTKRTPPLSFSKEM